MFWRVLLYSPFVSIIPVLQNILGITFWFSYHLMYERVLTFLLRTLLGDRCPSWIILNGLFHYYCCVTSSPMIQLNNICVHTYCHLNLWTVVCLLSWGWALPNRRDLVPMLWKSGICQLRGRYHWLYAWWPSIRCGNWYDIITSFTYAPNFAFYCSFKPIISRASPGISFSDYFWLAIPRLLWVLAVII